MIDTERPQWDGDGLDLNPAWPENDRREWLVPSYELPEGVTTEMRFVSGHAIRRLRENGQDYGIQGMSMLWTMKGPAGGVTYEAMTLWTPELELEQGPFGSMKLREYPGLGVQPIGGPIILHMHPARAEYALDSEPQDCPVLGGPCVTDATYTAGENIWKRFVMTGDEKAIWWSLLHWYREVEQRAANAEAAAPKAVEG